ncbi:hypothetical protein EQG68_01625 [Flavobacterium piscinae]|uniref:Tetratricopeptide repeat protein n=1 Tax=Flavobacterium piscinae TaxID=2506424 RepID=A0A4V1N570_9FLAO|nr:hypothetical protein [Flavobacterium piscinae]RXR34636.1 hypothetical protein EQG68_01625 [Flavobacterium piscinae]
MNKKYQSFEDKVFAVVVILLLIKVIYILLSIGDVTSVQFMNSFFGTLFFGILILVLLRGFTGNFDDFFSGNGDGYDSSVYIRESVFDKIAQKYRDLAEKNIHEGNYQKAAYIYLKLLKDPYTAASTLYDGGHYLEAAAINLNYLKNEERAGECFEKGKSYSEALKLYKKLELHEKTGDVYLLMNNRKDALIYFEKAITSHVSLKQYIKASLIYQFKIESFSKTQEMLMNGWDENADAQNCLQHYFDNIVKPETLLTEIQSVYENKTTERNLESFLQIIKLQYKKDEALQQKVKTISYEIIAKLIDQKPEICSELAFFNQDNVSITKDILKFKLNKKRK